MRLLYYLLFILGKTICSLNNLFHKNKLSTCFKRKNMNDSFLLHLKKKLVSFKQYFNLCKLYYIIYEYIILNLYFNTLSLIII